MFVNDPVSAAAHRHDQLRREAAQRSILREAGVSDFGDLASLAQLTSTLVAGFRTRGQHAAQRARRAIEEWVRERQDFPRDTPRRA